MVRFRPTPAQAIGRGGLLGGVAGTGISLVAAALALVAVQFGRSLPGAAWLVILSPLALLPLTGAVSAVALRRDVGVDVDEAGIRLMPTAEKSDQIAPWRGIDDLRTERRGWRTYVVIYLATGAVHRLAAPYDGRLLAHDGAFERKLFMLRHLWETHRSFTIHTDQHLGGAATAG